jgi:hypothetical protein
MVDIADGPANHGIEREGSNDKIVCVFDPENFRRQQIAAIQCRISKLKPKRYGW